MGFSLLEMKNNLYTSLCFSFPNTTVWGGSPNKQLSLVNFTLLSTVQYRFPNLKILFGKYPKKYYCHMSERYNLKKMVLEKRTKLAIQCTLKLFSYVISYGSTL